MNRTVRALQLLSGAGLLAALMGCGAALTPTQISLGVSSQTITQEGSLTLTAQAEGTSLLKVAFFDGANKLGEDDSAPYSYEVKLTKDQNGERTYRSVALDGQGTSLAVSEQLVQVVIPSASPASPQPAPNVQNLIIKGVAQTSVNPREPQYWEYRFRFGGAVGDSGTNPAYEFRSSLSFSLANIPDGISAAQISSARLRLTPRISGNPFSGLKSCDPTCRNLLVEDFAQDLQDPQRDQARDIFKNDRPALASWFDSDDKDNGETVLVVDVTGVVRREIASGRNPEQRFLTLALRFAKPTNGDSKTDYIFFYGGPGNQDTTDKLLEITYTSQK